MYNGPPKLVNSTGVEVLRDHCPHLVNDNQTFTCCDNEQINDLAKNVLQAANLLQRCPACYANFLKIICEFTCSPKQSSFLNVINIDKNVITKSKKNSLICHLVSKLMFIIFLRDRRVC